MDFNNIQLPKMVTNPPLPNIAYTKMAEQEKNKIIANVKAYYDEKSLGIEGGLSDSDIGDIININDNGALVRSGGRLVQVIGGNADED